MNEFVPFLFLQKINFRNTQRCICLLCFIYIDSKGLIFHIPMNSASGRFKIPSIISSTVSLSSNSNAGLICSDNENARLEIFLDINSF